MNYNGHAWKPAEYWKRLQEGGCECQLCPHHCHIREGHAGRCRVRACVGGELKATGYGVISSAHLDPIEKKPLYHFHPGTMIFSIGGWGCNFACSFCQNWEISQDFRFAPSIQTPEQIVAAMKAEGCPRIAYTYNEPLVGFEFVRDCARLVREGGGENVVVTNGYLEEGPAAELLPLIDALNVDIKSMDEGFYRKYCRGELAPVLKFCIQAVKAGCHVEITNLVIPGGNDSDDGFARLAAWIRDELGPLTPLHLSAFHPDYQLDVPPTPVGSLQKAAAICNRTLSYVYVGNVNLMTGQNTLCPGCGTVQIQRIGYETRVMGLRDGCCLGCRRKADIKD